jgi:hypothetical protein
MYLIKYAYVGTDRILVATVNHDNNANLLSGFTGYYNGFIRFTLDASDNILTEDLWFDTSTGSSFKLPRAL